MKKLNILFISDFFPPHTLGGAEISTFLLAKELQKKNNCFVLTQKFQERSWNIKKVKIYPLLERVEYSSNSIKSRVSYVLSSVIKPIYNFFRIKNFIKKNKIDIIHFVPSSYHISSQILAAKLSNKPIVIDVRDFPLLCPVGFMGKQKCCGKCYICIFENVKNKNPFLKIFFLGMSFIESLLFKINISIIKKIIKNHRSLKIVAVSNFLKNKLIAFSYPKDKISVIKNISEPLKEKKVSRLNEIVLAARLQFEKGIWDAIKAFELINNKNLVFDIVGEGSELDKIKDYIIKKNIKNIKLLGKLSNEEVLKKYAESKIILGPSIAPEGFGRYILESISTKTPLITTPVGGNPEGIKDHETGLLVPPNNPEQLAKAIKELLTNKKLYNKIVKNLGKEAWKYSSETIGKQRLRLYEQVIKENKNEKTN